MRVFALSDVHVDYLGNLDWVLGLSDSDYQQDILLLAGDISDLPARLEIVFASLHRKFQQVFFVPGNHELWVKRCRTSDSLIKFDLVMRLAREHGIKTNAWHSDALSVVPLLAWYDFSFGESGDYLRKVWGDFYCCQWPAHFDEEQISRYFLSRNEGILPRRSATVISFSHFLPRIDIMPSMVPLSQRYLYPVLGSTALGAQVANLKPHIHVYGHSHVNNRLAIDGVEYVNNAFGYPSETYMTQRRLVCIYDEEMPLRAGDSCCG